jgi:DNA-binding transcriptional ArsR family regulator
VICPHCGGCIHDPKLEPFYSLAEAVRLIPLSYSSLTSHLSYYKTEFPAVYFDSVLVEAKNKRTHRRTRLLTATEIKRIRNYFLSGPGKPRVV